MSRFRSLYFFEILFSLLVLASLILLSSYLRRNNIKQQKARDVETVYRIANEVDHLFFDALDKTLSASVLFPRVKEALIQNDGSLCMDYLQVVSATYPNSVVYLLDKVGVTIAGTPFNAAGDTFTGNRYDFRPYFYQSRKFGSSVYPAVGVTSMERGLYFSRAVTIEGEFAGVLVIKMGISDIELFLMKHCRLNLSLITPEGILFSTCNPDYLFTYITPLSQEELSGINESRQFANLDLKPLSREVGANYFKMDNKRYYYSIIDINQPGWKVLFFKDDSEYDFSNQTFIVFSIFSFMILLLLTALFYMVHIISQKISIEKKLRIYESVVNQSPLSIVITDLEGHIEYVNPFFTHLTGYSQEEIKGKTPSLFKSGLHDNDFYKHIWDKINSGKSWMGEFYNKKKDGSLYWENSMIYPLINSRGNNVKFIGIKEDITEKKKILHQLEYYATIDEMTSVLNRRTGIEFLLKKIDQIKKEGDNLALCYADLNNLKKVNDSLGHKAGDDLIQICTDIMKQNIRTSDVVCRLGGDEFIIILPHSPEKVTNEIILRIRKGLEQENREKDYPFEVSMSLGTAQYDPDRHENIDDLIVEAETRMYEDKRRSKSSRGS